MQARTPAPPPADADGEEVAIRRTLRTVVLWTVASLAAIAVVVLATAPIRQANHLYAAPTAPLATADAQAAAAKAKAAAARAQLAAERAQTAAASKAAQP